MRNLLRTTNPAETWLAQRFMVKLTCPKDQHILVRFDLKSTGEEGYRFKPWDVIARFGHVILVDPLEDSEQYIDVATSIGEKLNAEMDRTAQLALVHARQSLLILDALDAGDVSLAKRTGISLGESLLYFGAFADRIWGNWLESVADHLKTL